MMRNLVNPKRSDWPSLCQRPAMQLEFLEGVVKNIITRVRASGDEALKDLSLQFDKVNLENIRVTEKEMEAAQKEVPEELKSAIRTAIQNIKTFHEAQQYKPLFVETMPGVKCWRKAVAIEKVGIYIPGGTAPLFSTLLMLGIPATLAGCKEIILCSPSDSLGSLHPAILFSAKEIGINKIYKIGGAQAIAAMAYGTATVPSVYKIFGPGNQYVTKAKQLINADGIAIDMPAGPSEVMIIADEDASSDFIAADLLSQAEHGKDSQVVLISNSNNMLEKVNIQLTLQLEKIPRKDIAAVALQNSLSILMENESDMIDFINNYAPEHLIINTNNCELISEKITNAGSVFLGAFTPESVGDYASGTNHTLPTNGFAKAYSGVSLSSFQKFITYQQLSEEGLKMLGPVVEKMAIAEQLVAHQRAVSIRLDTL